MTSSSSTTSVHRIATAAAPRDAEGWPTLQAVPSPGSLIEQLPAAPPRSVSGASHPLKSPEGPSLSQNPRLTAPEPVPTHISALGLCAVPAEQLWVPQAHPAVQSSYLPLCTHKPGYRSGKANSGSASEVRALCSLGTRFCSCSLLPGAIVHPSWHFLMTGASMCSL